MKKKSKTKEDNSGFALTKENYFLLAVAFVIIILGFILMSGGGSDDPNVFDESIFNWRRITLAPIVVFIGFLFVIYAIMKKPKNKEKKSLNK